MSATDLDRGAQCDVRKGEHPDPMKRICNRPAVLRYRTGVGYMLMCEEHGAKHASICERWDGKTWLALNSGAL